jgi:hypothetical protein
MDSDEQSGPAEFPFGYWPDGYFPDGYWPEPAVSPWTGSPCEGIAARCTAAVLERRSVESAADRIMAALLDRPGVETIAARLTDRWLDRSGGEGIAARLANCAAGGSGAENLAARLFQLGAGLERQIGGIAESIAVRFFGCAGEEEMFAEDIIYHVNEGEDRAIRGVFQPTPPIVEDFGGRQTVCEATLRISYDATLGVAIPQPFKDRVTIRGETWQVLPAAQKTGGHWALPLRRLERAELIAGRVRPE